MQHGNNRECLIFDLVFGSVFGFLGGASAAGARGLMLALLFLSRVFKNSKIILQ